MTAAFRRWAFGPVDTAPMAALRIACGLLVLGWTVSLLPDAHAFLDDDGLTRSAVHGTRGWWAVDLVSPYAALALLALAALALTVGWHARAAAVAVTLLLIAVQRRDVYMLNSGDLLLRHLALYVALMPCGEVWSLDARRRGSSSPRAPWGLRLLQVQVSIVYFFSVVAKLHGDSWQDGTAVGRAVQLADLQRFLIPEAVATSITASALMTYGTILVEGALVFGLWLPRFRWWAMAAGVSIHLGIEATLLIGWFSLAIIVCYLAFVPGDVLRRVVARVLERVRPPQPVQDPTISLPSRIPSLAGPADPAPVVPAAVTRVTVTPAAVFPTAEAPTAEAAALVPAAAEEALADPELAVPVPADTEPAVPVPVDPEPADEAPDDPVPVPPEPVDEAPAVPVPVPPEPGAPAPDTPAGTAVPGLAPWSPPPHDEDGGTPTSP